MTFAADENGFPTLDSFRQSAMTCAITRHQPLRYFAAKTVAPKLGLLLAVLLAVILVVGAGCQGKEKERAAKKASQDLAAGWAQRSPLQKGVSYLMSRQSDDGLWRSEYYGNLKDGAAMTAFVLYALPVETSDIPESKSAMQRAVEALVPQINDKGFVTNANGPDYTNYGTALLLLACKKHDLKLPAQARHKMLKYLFRAQLDSEEGFDENNPDFGGWDLSGWMTGRRPTTGSNISVTSHVVRALMESALPTATDDPLRSERTRMLAQLNVWLSRIQRPDGGFVFHPRLDHDGNKAGWNDGDQRQQTRSYGTATADGLQLLKAMGRRADAPDSTATVEWLTSRTGGSMLARVPGFEHESGNTSWANGLRYYYWYSISQSLDLFSKAEAKRIATTIRSTIESNQKGDGSWQNANARMREDDPIIATCFALVAIWNCRSQVDR